jgi:Flp pilus assembly protein TadG
MSASTEPRPDGPAGEQGAAEQRAAEHGAAVVEFVLVSALALLLAMGVAQLGLFLWERNALMGSVSEGARVAATEGRSVADGRRVATELLRQAAGTRVASAVPIEGSEAGGLVVLRAEGTLPSFVPGVPGLPVRMTARMHDEERL